MTGIIITETSREIMVTISVTHTKITISRGIMIEDLNSEEVVEVETIEMLGTRIEDSISVREQQTKEMKEWIGTAHIKIRAIRNLGVNSKAKIMTRRPSRD